MEDREHFDEIIHEIGEHIKTLRIEAGYTSYVDFAIKNDMQPKQYWKLEAGQANFTIRTILRILEIHNMTLEEFFKGLK